MRIAKDDVDVRMEIPGAVIRQRGGFGDVAGFADISGEYFSLSAGVDTTPLFEGLVGDLCQCPHWGYVLQGELITTEGFRELLALRRQRQPHNYNIRIPKPRPPVPRSLRFEIPERLFLMAREPIAPRRADLLRDCVDLRIIVRSKDADAHGRTRQQPGAVVSPDDLQVGPGQPPRVPEHVAPQ